MAELKFTVGQRVQIKDKGHVGVIAFIGMTEFASGKWIGINLDEKLGKNDGTVKEKKYFDCEPNHGIFVRQSQIVVVPDDSRESKQPKTSKTSGLRAPSSQSRLSRGSSPNSSPSTPRKGVTPEPAEIKKKKIEEEEEEEIPPTISALLPEAFAGSVQDFKEKLLVLHTKRQADKTKLKELEKYKLLYQQMSEYKSKWSTSQSDLQQQLKIAKKDFKEALEAKETMENDVVELNEAVEMATLDKEMAEEKCETLQQELEALREKNEELALDLEIIKSEISESGMEGAVTSAQTKQLEQQNIRLKEALVRLRDLSNQEKLDHQAVQKALEKQTSVVKNLTSQNEKLKAENSEAETMIDDLKDQLDAALGAEEMVEKLTDKNLDLEEELQEKQETISDLETLREMYEEMEEHHTETEHEMREELDMANARTREVERKLDVSHETTADYQQTIVRFRELVGSLEAQLEELRQDSNESREGEERSQDIKSKSQAVLSLNLRLKNTEARAQAKGLDMELRKLDVQQGADHVDMLKRFIPDFFFHGGGDYDGVQAILLIRRLVFKTGLISTHIQEKFHINELLLSNEPIKESDTDRLSFACLLNVTMVMFQRTLNRFNRVMMSCDVPGYQRIGNLYADMATHEKSIDNIIDMLRKDELEDSISLAPIEKASSYFKGVLATHFGEHPLSHMDIFLDYLKVYTGCVDGVTIVMKVLQAFPTEGSHFCVLLQEWTTLASDMKNNFKRIRRRLPTEDSHRGFAFGAETLLALEDQSENVLKLLGLVREIHGLALQQIVLLSDNEKLTNNQLLDMAKRASGLLFGVIDSNEAIEAPRICFENMNGFFERMVNAIQDGEYDVEHDSRRKGEAPFLTRALTVKRELCDADGLGLRLQQKDNDILELKKIIKMKTNELGEAGVKISLLEQKLESAAKEVNADVAAVQKELDEANEKLRKKEKEFETTMDALQSDIDALEEEKVELKKRHEALSKKSTMAQLTRQAKGGFLSNWSKGEGDPGASATVPSQVHEIIKDSPLTLSLVASLRRALALEREEVARLRGADLRSRIERLQPINIPKKLPSENMKSMAKEASDLYKRACQLAASPKVIDLTKSPDQRGGQSRLQSLSERNRALDLKSDLENLKSNVQFALASHYPAGRVEADFSSYASPHYLKTLHEKSHLPCVGKVRIPAASSRNRLLLMTSQQMNTLHQLFG